MLNHFPERLLNELMLLSSKDQKVKYRFFAPPDRNKACFVGASIISNMGAFKKMWITKSEYKEHGDRIFEIKQF